MILSSPIRYFRVRSTHSWRGTPFPLSKHDKKYLEAVFTGNLASGDHCAVSSQQSMRYACLELVERLGKAGWSYAEISTADQQTLHTV